jgi:hypothetical protein
MTLICVFNLIAFNILIHSKIQPSVSSTSLSRKHCLKEKSNKIEKNRRASHRISNDAVQWKFRDRVVLQVGFSGHLHNKCFWQVLGLLNLLLTLVEILLRKIEENPKVKSAMKVKLKEIIQK